MKQYTVAILSLLVFMGGFSPIHAAEEVRVVSAFGVSKKEAVVNALLEAVQQVKGLKISGVEKMRSSFLEADSTFNGENQSSSSMKSSQNQEVQKQTQGVISSYEVLDIKRGESGQGWEAQVKVHIPVYKTPGISPNSRRKMAVVPFRTGKGYFNFSNQRISASKISSMFTQKLVTGFTQTRKFTVLDRDYYEEFLGEKNLILSPDAPLAEQMKIGEVLGVDYLVVGTITDASASADEYKIQVTGETGWQHSGLFIVDYRIIVMATRQIKWSDSVKVVLDSDDFQTLGADRPELIEEAILKRAASDLVNHAMDNIYPLRVAEVQSNGQLILNQGGAGLREGLMLDLFQRGEIIRDTYTGESLGAAETLVGTAEIVRVTAKTSYARIVDGNPRAISKGDICRRAKNKTDDQANHGRASDVLVPASGGVVLPFD